ncbi:Gp37-like protein [Mycolicibacterium palauense]|uniref:Gp37-like protein n=1 Tax=Mycolicibacterium palauense TaxID=2034511 RepID=UPI000BFEBD5D|nr:hypothetical protein [Mycolicibacterium palauense]
MVRIKDVGDYLDLADIQARLLSANPHEVMSAARAIADLEQRPPHDIVATLRTNTAKVAGELGDREYLRLNFPRLGVPVGRLVLKGSDPMADVALRCDETVVPFVADIGPIRWSGRVDVATDKFGDPDKADTVDCTLLHDKAWLTRVCAWPWWFMPLQIQGPPSSGVAFGNAITVIKYLFAGNFLRIQLGLWEAINNLVSLNLDWRSYFATLTTNDANPLDIRDLQRLAVTPVYVVRGGTGWKDTSPFISLNWKMEDLLTVVDQTCRDCALTIEVWLWEPGMEQPDEHVTLTAPTICIDVKDRQGVTGFSGTWIDGTQRTFVDLADSMLGRVLKPFLNPDNEYAPRGVNIAPAFGVHYTMPWTVFNCDHPDSGIRGEIAHHGAVAWRTISGGKSPAWFNRIVDNSISFFVDMLSIAIGVTGIPSTVLEGAFNDLWMAYQLTDNFDRRLAQGPFGWPEVFKATGSGSYTLDAFFQQKTLQFDTEGYASGRVTVDNCYPYEFGRDCFPGGMSTLIRRGKVLSDFIEDAALEDSGDKYAKITYQIGDGRAEDADAAKIQRRIGDLQAGLNIALLANG